jgi:tetratricopeptide (TPR) repeat protein
VAETKQNSQQSLAAQLQRAVEKHQAGDLGGAARAYRAILKRAPDHPDALHLLGLTAHQSGDQARAIRHMEKAANLKPGEPLFLNNLGLAQHAAGQFSAAEESFRAALSVAPDDRAAKLHLGTVLALQDKNEAALTEFMVLINSGTPEPLCHAKAAQSLRQLGRFEEAEAQFRSAVALAPEDLELLASLASLLQVRGREDEAIELYRQVLDGRPDYPDVLINLANCFITQGLLDQAQSSFEAALKLDQGLEGAVTGIVYVHERKGDYDQARERLTQVMGNSVSAPLSPVVAAAFATMAGRMDREDEAVERAERSLAVLLGQIPTHMHAGTAVAGTGEMNLRFALGRLYERRGAYDRAFAQFKAANAMNRQIFEPEAYAQYISDLIATFDHSEPDIVAENQDQHPVFIVGMPRSGTTLVEQILASHDQVHGGGELTYLHQAIDTMPVQNPYDYRYPRVVNMASRENLNAAAVQYLSRLLALAPQSARITDKLPGNILHVGMIARLLPGAKIIHVRRDPLDTCLSCFTQNFGERLPFTTDFARLADYYKGYERISRHWGRILGPRMLELSYEDLVEDTEKESRRMVDFIGLNWDPACLEFHGNERIVTTASYDQVRQPIYRGSIGRWRSYETEMAPLISALEGQTSPQDGSS